MKAKTIKAVLEKKHAELVDSIDDEKVKKLVKENSIVTGGAIASMLLREKVNDFDYYFTDKETAVAVANYYVNKFKQINPYYIEKIKDKGALWVEVKDDRVRIMIKSAGAASESADSDYKYFESEDPLDATKYVDEIMDIIDKDNEDKDKPKVPPCIP